MRFAAKVIHQLLKVKTSAWERSTDHKKSADSRSFYRAEVRLCSNQPLESTSILMAWIERELSWSSSVDYQVLLRVSEKGQIK